MCTLASNCLHDVAPVYLSTMFQPVSENIGRRSLRPAACGYLAVPITKDGALRSVQFQCGLTVYMELFAGVAARPVINPNIILPPTQDLSFRQSVCFIIALVTVISLLQRANITAPYNHTYNRYVQSTDGMTDGRMTCHSNTALCVTSRGKINTVIIFHLGKPLRYMRV